jgi:hypothetical protein
MSSKKRDNIIKRWNYYKKILIELDVNPICDEYFNKYETYDEAKHEIYHLDIALHRVKGSIKHMGYKNHCVIKAMEKDIVMMLNFGDRELLRETLNPVLCDIERIYNTNKKK